MGILFEIKYKIYGGKRNEYLELVKKLKNFYLNNGIEDYKLYEDEKGQNEFTELFIFADEAGFEKFEDDTNEEVNNLLSILVSEMVIDKKVRYKTKKQVEL